MNPVRDKGIAMSGFKELGDALARIGGGRGNYGLEYEMRRRLRIVGEKVGGVARQFVTHTTGRHGDPDVPRLEDDVRVSVTRNSASVFTTAPHGGVQNQGGGPKAGWSHRGPHVRRDRASGWLNKAVESQQEFVAVEMDGLLDWVESEFMRGAR